MRLASVPRVRMLGEVDFHPCYRIEPFSYL